MTGLLVVRVVDGCFGGYSGGETPGLIPNPEAKPSSADGTALGRVWESRTPPDSTLGKAHTSDGVGLFCIPRAQANIKARPPADGPFLSALAEVRWLMWS